MLYFLVGPSGAFTSWCEEVILAAMRQRAENAEVIRADGPRDLALELLRRQVRSSALVALNQAPASLYSAIRDSGRKFVVVSDDPICCLFESVQANSGDIVRAVRAVASGIVNLPLYMALPNALVLQPPLETCKVAEIANHLGLSLFQEALSTSPPRLSRDANRWWGSLSDEVRTIVTGALGPMLDSQRVSAFNWASSFFWQGGDRSKTIDGPVDITGRARCLFEGPAITLPLGSWRLSLQLDFSEMAVGNAIRVEVWAGTVLGSQDLVPRRMGQVGIDFDFTIDEVPSGPLLIRVLLLRAAFDGTVSFVGRCVAHRCEPGSVVQRLRQIDIR